MRKKSESNFLAAFAFGPCIYSSDSTGSIIITTKSTDRNVVNKIVSGELRGLSPEIIIRKWECSICHRDLEKCVHEVGKFYNNKKCVAIARDIEFTGVSIVDNPEDSRCRITDLLLIKEENGKRTYEWYGFKVNNEDDRFKNIGRALKNGLIPEEAAFSFSKFFSIRIEGKVSYSVKQKFRV